MLVPAAMVGLGRQARHVLSRLPGCSSQHRTRLLAQDSIFSGREPRYLPRDSNPAWLSRKTYTALTCSDNFKGARVPTRSFSDETAAPTSHRNVIDDISAVTLQLHRDHLVVQHPRWPMDDVFLSLAWLRDHCRCRHCYNHNTHQRETDIRDLVFDVHPLQFNMNATCTTVEIIWHDGHQSEYSLQWLWANSYVSHKYRQMQQDRLWQRCLWDARSAAREDLTAVDCDHLMASEAGVRQLMKGFLTHGAATVTGVSPSLSATQQVIERVGVVQHTMYGGVWEFCADGEHADTAYTQHELLPHTDGTYYSEPPGVQVFHCLEHDGGGGETTLVDGFAGLQRLHAADPAAYHLLSAEPCVGEYRDPARGLHLVGHDTVIAHLPDTEPTPQSLLRLRFNPYDRAPARRTPPARLEPFYRAYRRLAEILWAARQQRRLKLTPGTVLFIDNWRVLHGRTAFSGRRQMCGGYMARSDVMSRARVAGLLV